MANTEMHPLLVTRLLGQKHIMMIQKWFNLLEELYNEKCSYAEFRIEVSMRRTSMTNMGHIFLDQEHNRVELSFSHIDQFNGVYYSK